MKNLFILLYLITGSFIHIHAQTQIGADIDGEAIYDWSGYSVSLSADGTRVAIGALGNDGDGQHETGHVRIYGESGGTWLQIGADIDGETTADRLGASVSLSADGTRVAIGATRNTDYPDFVRIYEESGGTWVQVGNAIDGQVGSSFVGFSVSLSPDGTRVAIGSSYDNGNNSGYTRIYEESGGTWIQIGNDINGEEIGDLSGKTVSLSFGGTRIAIGAPFNDGNGSAAGHVRIYEESEGTWIQVGNDIDGETAGDRSGWSVSLSAEGTRLAIGARINDGNGANAGHVRIYEESNGTWIQLGDDIDGEAIADQSGESVSLSADGTKVAIGAPDNDGNGSAAGHVRIYEESNGAWIQINCDINGEAADDQSGVSVSLSADGSRVAVGALYNSNGSGINAGHVRIYGNLSDSPSCEPPSNVQHTLHQPSKVNITWNAMPNVDKYDIIYRVKGTSQWTRIGVLNNYKTLRYLAPNTIYQYRIRSHCNCGTWDFANATPIRQFNTANIPILRLGSIDIETGTISISPNPARDVVNVEFSTETRSNVTLSIKDITGKLVYQNNIKNTEGLQSKAVDVSNLRVGYYIIILQSNEKRDVGKFIITR